MAWTKLRCVNVQFRSVSKDEHTSVCSWSAGATVAETWYSQHYTLPGTMCSNTGMTLISLILTQVCSHMRFRLQGIKEHVPNFGSSDRSEYWGKCVI